MNNHVAKRESGLWAVPAIFLLNLGAAFFVSMVTDGIKLLAMPIWAWIFFGLTVAGTGVLYVLNVRNGQDDKVKIVTLQAGLLSIFLLILFYVFGLTDNAPSTYDDLVNVDKILNEIAHSLAWISMIVAPSVALIVNGFVWQSHAREAHAQ